MKHLTDIGALSDQEITSILSRALAYDEAVEKREDIGAPLAGRIQFNLFYENSTRTSLSFDLAGRKMGLEVVNVPVAASSIHKGESLRDTVLTLCAQGADAMVLRASGAGSIDAAKSAIKSAGFETRVINAGEGAFGHPTQALLDAATLLKAHHRKAEEGLDGLTISIIGDLSHSRVAASCSKLFARMGATVRLCAPEDLLPVWKSEDAAMVTTSRDEAIKDADVVMALRIQTERFGDELPLDPQVYRSDYGLSMEALSFAKPAAFVMHPGPMNRGVEIDNDVADDQSISLILQQVAMGVPLRMAVLAELFDL
ncbi:aspartate carbamoyltransferase catalytic subunit [Parvularcula sp. ZS-1/3]|uniref:Aspartate carbamoyltransferase n=1 Tax=Parvularcula mediterranea TaxID=2732508 RepID=A0A7Y3RM76_9PROT|nr:aspartate carbamoyltransferase catalytic subunit [Parvularcula mediterranea]NNU16681.1 aspartate carbamoyltransferase catalytic subunit [Parvularcula mediterranea]